MITLTRLEEKHGGTWGVLNIEGYAKDYFTLELPWLNNQNDISCIPTGKYRLVKTGIKRFPWKVCDVPDRPGVYLHCGNWIEEIRGCILIGSAFGKILDKPALLQSGPAMQSFNSKLSDVKETVLLIKDFEMPGEKPVNEKV